MPDPESPRWALVLWPDAYDGTLPARVPLDGLQSAIDRGAVVIAREDDEICRPPVVRDRDPGDEDAC